MAKRNDVHAPYGQAPPHRTHSIRCYDSVWEAARRRATEEGTNVNHVINTILEGYGKGLINMPKVNVVFEQPKSA